MTALLIWSAWLILGAIIYAIMPYLPGPKGMNLCLTKIIRIQTTLFITGWISKLFALPAYFMIGKVHAIAILICALVMLFSVFILGVIFRSFPTNKERIAKLKRELAELEPPTEKQVKVDDTINPLTSPIYPPYSNRRF